MTPEQLIERVKSLGVEFWQPSETLEAMLKQTEAARIMRIDRLKDFVRINAERLAKLKEEIRTLPEQIAKWEAERERLESQTGADIVREAVRAEKPRAEVEAMANARQKPALLDLRELPAGTVCEARDRIQIPYTAVSIRAGVLFTIEEHCKPPIAPGEDVRVRVASTTDTWAIPALVPARVVKEGQ